MPLPELLMVKVDEYVDSLAPEIQPRIAGELETFQNRTIDSLEDQVIKAFRSLFDTSNQSGHASRDPNDVPPDAYGGRALPFANEVAQLTRSFGQLSDEAGDNLRDIFSLADGSGQRSDGNRGQNNEGLNSAKSFLSFAMNKVQDHLEKQGGGQQLQLDGLLGTLTNTIKEAASSPEEKARAISPEIKEQVGAKLREQHTSVAERFTKIALDRLKQWLRHNTDARDIGDGTRAEFEDQMKDMVKSLGGLFGKKSHSDEGSRDIDNGQGQSQESGGGFSKVISDKLSTGIAKVHREVRLEFRTLLGNIEKELFELLPDKFQRPLEKILGGNPFDAQLDNEAGGRRDFGDDLKAKLIDKIRGLIKMVQEILRTSILDIVNGGHRKLERESWLFVQNMVELKVQKYLPKVKITVPDDIGNEGVSVGKPTETLPGPVGQIPELPSNNPPQDYKPPQQSYGNQTSESPGNNPPPHNYNQPQQGYGGQVSELPGDYPPQQSYHSPQQGYNAPTQNYDLPQQGYNRPSHNYTDNHSQRYSNDQSPGYNNNQPPGYNNNQSPGYNNNPPSQGYNRGSSQNANSSYYGS